MKYRRQIREEMSASRRGAISRPTLFRWSVSFARVVWWWCVVLGISCYIDKNTFVWPLFFPSPPIFLITCPHIPLFLHRLVHYINSHVMSVFEPNWPVGYRIINFFFESDCVFFNGILLIWCLILPNFDNGFLENGCTQKKINTSSICANTWTITYVKIKNIKNHDPSVSIVLKAACPSLNLSDR